MASPPISFFFLIFYCYRLTLSSRNACCHLSLKLTGIADGDHWCKPVVKTIGRVQYVSLEKTSGKKQSVQAGHCVIFEQCSVCRLT